MQANMSCKLCFTVTYSLNDCELCDIKICSNCYIQKHHDDCFICSECNILTCDSKRICGTYKCWNCYKPSINKKQIIY